jgi:hypothetical protein
VPGDKGVARVQVEKAVLRPYEQHRKSNLPLLCVHLGPIGPGSVTEVNATTGALVRVISGPAFRFYYPFDVLAAGPDVFVGNLGLPSGKTGGVTVLDASTGAVVQVLKGPVSHPIAMAVAGNELVVANNTTGSVIEMELPLPVVTALRP